MGEERQRRAAGAARGETARPDGSADLEDALRRLEQDKEALQILFKLFMSEHKDDLWEIRSALRRQQPDIACRLLHTLKGVSANISASRLQIMAGELGGGCASRRS